MAANLEAGWDEAVRLVGPAGRGCGASTWRLRAGFEEDRPRVHQVLAVRPDDDGRADMPLTRRELLGL